MLSKYELLEYQKLLTCIKYFPDLSWRIIHVRNSVQHGRYAATHSGTLMKLDVVDDTYGCFVRLIECQKILLYSDLICGVTLENALSQMQKLVDKEKIFISPTKLSPKIVGVVVCIREKDNPNVTYSGSVS